MVITSQLIYKSLYALESRDSFATYAEMQNFKASAMNRGHISFCEETGKHYVFNVENHTFNSSDTCGNYWTELSLTGSGTGGGSNLLYEIKSSKSELPLPYPKIRELTFSYDSLHTISLAGISGSNSILLSINCVANFLSNANDISEGDRIVIQGCYIKMYGSNLETEIVFTGNELIYSNLNKIDTFSYKCDDESGNHILKYLSDDYLDDSISSYYFDYLDPIVANSEYSNSGDIILNPATIRTKDNNPLKGFHEGPNAFTIRYYSFYYTNYDNTVFADPNKIYLVPATGRTEGSEVFLDTSKFDEYISVDGKWELIGRVDTGVNLDNYWQNSALGTGKTMYNIENGSKKYMVWKDGDTTYYTTVSQETTPNLSSVAASATTLGTSIPTTKITFNASSGATVSNTKVSTPADIDTLTAYTPNNNKGLTSNAEKIWELYGYSGNANEAITVPSTNVTQTNIKASATVTSTTGLLSQTLTKSATVNINVPQPSVSVNGDAYDSTRTVTITVPKISPKNKWGNINSIQKFKFIYVAKEEVGGTIEDPTTALSGMSFNYPSDWVVLGNKNANYVNFEIQTSYANSESKLNSDNGSSVDTFTETIDKSFNCGIKYWAFLYNASGLYDYHAFADFISGEGPHKSVVSISNPSTKVLGNTKVGAKPVLYAGKDGITANGLALDTITTKSQLQTKLNSYISNNTLRPWKPTGLSYSEYDTISKEIFNSYRIDKNTTNSTGKDKLYFPKGVGVFIVCVRDKYIKDIYTDDLTDPHPLLNDSSTSRGAWKIYNGITLNGTSGWKIYIKETAGETDADIIITDLTISDTYTNENGESITNELITLQ